MPARVLQEGFTGDFYLIAWLRRHSLLAFFTLTFGIDSARPYLISSLPSLRHAPPFILVIVIALILIMFCGGPTLSSITLTGILGGKSGLRRLLRNAFNQDVDARWFITALFLPAAVVWLPITAINALLGGPVAPIFNPPGREVEAKDGQYMSIDLAQFLLFTNLEERPLKAQQPSLNTILKIRYRKMLAASEDTL